MSETFEAGGVQFQLGKIPVLESLAIYPNAARVMGPLLSIAGSLQGTDEKEANDSLLQLISEQLSNVAVASVELPALVNTFAKHCKVKLPNLGDRWVDLAPMLDQAFGRKHARLLEWVARCVMTEFNDVFLDGLGQLQTLAMSNHSTSPSGSTGSSGV